LTKRLPSNDKHAGRDKEILRRKIVYETVKLKNPNRWSGETRIGIILKKVYLNYLQKRGCY